jgi:hypothetical protein
VVIAGGIGGWGAHDLQPVLTSSASAVLASAVFDDAIAAHRTFSVETRHPVAAIMLAAGHGKPGSIGGHELTDVDLGTVRYSIGPLALGTNLEVWHETRGGANVLNISWASNGAIEVMSFRRGDWEQIILDRANWLGSVRTISAFPW